MTEINGQHYIDELKFNLETGDTIKISLVLAQFPNVDADTQRKAVFELMRADFEATAPAVARIVGLYPDLLDDAPSLGNAFSQNMIDCPSALLCALQNKEYKDKSAFIDMARALALEEATPALIRLLSSSPNQNEIHNCIIALGEIGGPSSVATISDFLYSRSKELSIAAIKALGAIASEEAIIKLTERIGSDTGLDMLILKVFAAIQDPRSMEMLVDTLGSPNAQLRNFAKSKLIDIGNKAVPYLVEGLRNKVEDRVIHILNVLGDIGDSSSVSPLRKLLHDEPKNPNVRFAAYEALANMPVKTGAFALTTGLMDPVDHVALAAARAIDRNFCDILENGLKNLLGHSIKETERYAMLFIVSGSDKIFLSLIEDKTFLMSALGFLKNSSSKDVCAKYETLLRSNGYVTHANTLKPTLEKQECLSKQKVWAIDDSRMMLAIYKNVLHTFGYDAKLFEFPESALDEFEEEQPDLILTDLNMPNVSGIELTKAIRSKASGKNLPIIMITTQSDAKEDQDIREAGVTQVLRKPFTNEELSEAINAQLSAKSGNSGS